MSYAQLLEALCIEEGEEALIPSPHYATYYNSTIAAEGIPVLIKLKEEDNLCFRY